MHSLPIDSTTILLGAAKLLRERGWCRGTMMDSFGQMCLRGAIKKAMANAGVAGIDDGQDWLGLEGDVLERAASVIDPVFGLSNALRVSSWNDFQCLNDEQGAELLEHAAVGMRVAPPR